MRKIEKHEKKKCASLWSDLFGGLFVFIVFSSHLSFTMVNETGTLCWRPGRLRFPSLTYIASLLGFRRNEKKKDYMQRKNKKIKKK